MMTFDEFLGKPFEKLIGIPFDKWLSGQTTDDCPLTENNLSELYEE